MVLMHQANLRINEYVQKSLGLPDSKVFHNVQRYANTTAATIPLFWDEGVRDGRIESGRPGADGRLRRGHDLGGQPRPCLVPEYFSAPGSRLPASLERDEFRGQ